MLHPTAHREDVILHLKTHGNWKSNEAARYVDEIMDQGYVKAIMGGVRENGPGFANTDAIRDGYPYAHRVKYVHVAPLELLEERM